MAASEEGATELAEAAAAETERIVGWLRLLAIALIGVGEEVAGGGPTEAGFLEAIAAYSVWGLSAVAWAYLRPVKPWFVLAGTAIDVVAITALVSLSGGAFSDARAAYFLIPIAVAFRFRPLFTAVASVVTIAAYLTQAFAHSASRREGAERFIALHAGYLAWVGLAAVLLSYVLARRTQRWRSSLRPASICWPTRSRRMPASDASWQRGSTITRSRTCSRRVTSSRRLPRRLRIRPCGGQMPRSRRL